MRRLYYILILVIIGILWGCYTWIDWVRAAIDGALAPVFAFLGAALSGTYTTIVTSPFWQTWIVPYQFWMGMGIMAIIAFLWVRYNPVQRVRKTPQIVRQSGPQYTAPQVIPEPAKPIPQSQPVEASKEEVKAE